MGKGKYSYLAKGDTVWLYHHHKLGSLTAPDLLVKRIFNIGKKRRKSLADSVRELEARQKISQVGILEYMMWLNKPSCKGLRHSAIGRKGN